MGLGRSINTGLGGGGGEGEPRGGRCHVPSSCQPPLHACVERDGVPLCCC